jgi:hypothetical protein
MMNVSNSTVLVVGTCWSGDARAVENSRERINVWDVVLKDLRQE